MAGWILAGFLSLLVAGGASAAERSPMMSLLPDPAPQVDPRAQRTPLQIAPDDSFALARLRELLASSPTARQMLDTLQRTPHVVARLRSDPTLQDRTGVPGRGMIRVLGGRVLALLEFDPELPNVNQQLQVIAHELAHAVEVASFRDVETTDDLRARLELAAYRRAFNIGDVRTLESPFATSVSTRTGEEVRSRRPLPGVLHRLAHQHQVELP